MRIGVHTSIAGGIELSLKRANELGCNTVQIFSHNPRRWAVAPIPRENLNMFRELRSNLSISPVFIHASYLINLATADMNLLHRSEELLAVELFRADEIGADYIVLHTGSASKDERKIAQKRAIDSLSRVMGRGKWGAGLLLENTAGERGDISSTIEDLAEILGGVNSVGISGICFDTCHGFSAGYDLRRPETIDSLLDKIERYIGFDKVKLIHFNDSKRDLGARVDRHEHIGKGKIGIKGFQIFFGREEIRSIPLILETPKKSLEDDKQNLAVARKILSGISKDSQKVKQNS